MTLTSAGHPPPLVVEPSGQTRFLEGEGGLPLGVDVTTEYGERELSLEPGSIVVLYTDGLVERRGRSIDEGLMELARAAQRRRATRMPSSTPSSATSWASARGTTTSPCSPSSSTPRPRSTERDDPGGLGLAPVPP